MRVKGRWVSQWIKLNFNSCQVMWLETRSFSSEFIIMTSFPSSRLLDLAFLRSSTEVLRLENKLKIQCFSPILRDDLFVESLF